MSGGNTTKTDCLELLEYFEKLFRKMLRDVEEAYHRTPLHVSSRPYTERLYRLIRSGLEVAVEEKNRMESS